MHSVTTRKNALGLGLKRFYTGRPCRNGHLAERYVSSGACTECTHPTVTGRDQVVSGKVLHSIQVALSVADAANLKALQLASEYLRNKWPEALAHGKAEAALRASVTLHEGATLEPTERAEHALDQYRAAGWTDAALVYYQFARLVEKGAPTLDQLEPTAKGMGTGLPSFIERGWTPAQLVEHGYATVRT